jgi:hypothetical protein
MCSDHVPRCRVPTITSELPLPGRAARSVAVRPRPRPSTPDRRPSGGSGGAQPSGEKPTAAWSIQITLIDANKSSMLIECRRRLPEPSSSSSEPGPRQKAYRQVVRVLGQVSWVGASLTMDPSQLQVRAMPRRWGSSATISIQSPSVGRSAYRDVFAAEFAELGSQLARAAWKVA